MNISNKSNSSLYLLLSIVMSLSLAINGENLFKLDCSNNQDKLCTLSSPKDGIGELKVQNMICVDTECKEALLFAENRLFTCQLTSKKSGECQKIIIKNMQPFQLALAELYQSIDRENADAQSLVNSGESANLDQEGSNLYMRFLDSKRALPFETLNYGRRKRQLPFETLNYGKRSQGSGQNGLGGTNCDCTGLMNLNSNNKRALPFESMLYGKRALPFETLNYGKRAYIPIDGYIMGKREE